MGTTTAQTQPIDTPVRQLSDQNPNGTCLGASPADLIAFYNNIAGVPQPASAGSLVGATGTVTVYSSTQSPTTVAPNTAAEQSLTVTGVATGQLVIVNKPTAQAGLLVGTARVSASNTIQLTLGNDTAASITPTATETYLVTAIPATMLLTATLSPAAVAPNTTSTQQFPVAGVGVNAAVAVNKPTAQAGLIITGADSPAAGVLSITFANLTAATITPTAAENYLVFAQQGISLAPVEQVKTAVLSPTTVAPNTTAEQTFTVSGLTSGTPVFVNKQTVQPGLSIAGSRVSAANTLAITFANNTSVSITPNQGETYYLGNFPGPAPAGGSSTAYNGVVGGSDHAALVALGLVGSP